MEYYGDMNKKRLKVISNFEKEDVLDTTSQIGFINSKGLFLDYTLKFFNEGIVSYGKHPCDAPTPWIMYSDCWQNMKKIKRNNKIYYIGNFYWNRDLYGVLLEEPRIGNDKVFTWKTNPRYGTLEAIIKESNFEYLCIVKADGNAFVEVKYTKQENKHRNNITIARIDVYNASNQDIVEAIKQWQKTIISDLSFCESISKWY